MAFDTAGLTKKAGPFPIWLWATFGIVGYVGFDYLHKRTATPAASSTADTSTIGVDPSLSGDSTVGDQFGAPPLPGSPGISGITTNDQWTTEAATALIDSGQSAWSPAEIETALWGYLNGQALVGNGTAIVNQALAEFGSPPEGTVAVLGGQPTTAGGTAQPSFTDNQQWASYALGVTDQEIANNPKPYGPADVSTAISAYINNLPLSSMQTTIVNHVLSLSGPPPTPVSSPGSLTSGS